MRKTTTSIIFALALVASASGAGQTLQSTSQEKKEIAAALVHHIQPSSQERSRDRVTITLRIKGDSSNELKRFIESTYPASQRFIADKERFERKHCMFDKRTKLPSLGIDLDEIELGAEGEAQVVAGFSVCLMGAQQSRYILKKLDGRWKVVDEQLEMII